MKRTIIYNIGTLAGILDEGTRLLKGEEMGHVESISNAYLVIEDGLIAGFGSMDALEEIVSSDETVHHIDAKGGYVLPCFCDSHTHIVYAGCRDGEFRDKIDGLSYEEIAGQSLFLRCLRSIYATPATSIVPANPSSSRPSRPRFQPLE